MTVDTAATWARHVRAHATAHTTGSPAPTGIIRLTWTSRTLTEHTIDVIERQRLDTLLPVDTLFTVHVEGRPSRAWHLPARATTTICRITGNPEHRTLVTVGGTTWEYGVLLGGTLPA